MRRLMHLLLAFSAAAACTGRLGSPFDSGGARSGGGSGSSAGGPGVLPNGSSPASAYPPPGIRRLSQAEIETAAAGLLGISAAPLAVAIGNDIRQSGFTRNGDQRMSSVQAEDYWEASLALAREAVTQRLVALAPCSNAKGSEACAEQFVVSFASAAYRRTPTGNEIAELLQVFRSGALDASYAAGIELVIAAVLQSGSFLYFTELGEVTAASSSPTRLSGEEIASHVSWLMTGKPASSELMSLGRTKKLDDGKARGLAARTLLQSADAKRQVQRMMLEWIGADDVNLVPKDSGLFAQWSQVHEDVLAESRFIVDSVATSKDSTLKALLTTEMTSLTPTLATYYGLSASGIVKQPSGRRGLLLAGAFAAAHSHSNSTGLVKRGAAVRKKLLCQDLPLPKVAGLPIVVPPADPSKTARERFSVHSANSACASCHALLDPIGFAFENFDPTGRYREQENGKTIDASGSLVETGDVDGPFQNAVELVERLAQSKTVRSCFGRQLFRFASGRSVDAEEQRFLDDVSQLSSFQSGNFVELLVAYIESDSFVVRQSP